MDGYYVASSVGDFMGFSTTQTRVVLLQEHGVCVDFVGILLFHCVWGKGRDCLQENGWELALGFL